MRRAIAAVQGVSYVLGGAWPLLHMRSFEAVTGPKVDEWLERTTAGIMVAIGAPQLWAARRDGVTPDPAAHGGGAGGGGGADVAPPPRGGSGGPGRRRRSASSRRSTRRAAGSGRSIWRTRP